MPDTDDAISVTSEESGSVLRPGKGDALDGLSTALRGDGLEDGLRLKGVEVEGDNENLGFEIPDLDVGLGGSAQPVSHGGEAEGVDDSRRLKRGKVTTLSQVPEHGGTVFTTRSAERTIRGHGNGVHVTLVTDEVGAELEPLSEGPDLHELVPTGRDDKGLSASGGEADA